MTTNQSQFLKLTLQPCLQGGDHCPLSVSGSFTKLLSTDITPGNIILAYIHEDQIGLLKRVTHGYHMAHFPLSKFTFRIYISYFKLRRKITKCDETIFRLWASTLWTQWWSVIPLIYTLQGHEKIHIHIFYFRLSYLLHNVNWFLDYFILK